MKRLLKRGTVKAFLVLLISMAGMTKCLAYDFSAVCQTGQTLYYKITDAEKHFVELINPKDIVDGSGWDGFTKPTGNLILPEHVYDANNIQYTLTSIGLAAFRDCPDLTAVTIPNSVTTVSPHAFYNCRGITSINIPDSLTTIAAYSFESCRGLTSITIPNSVTTIEWWAFQDCRGLTEITIPNSVTTIYDYAFMDCQSLTSVTIPSSVTRMGDNAFANCYLLSSVTMLPIVPPTGANFDPFNHDDNLTTLNVPYESLDAYKNAIHWCDHVSQMRPIAYKSVAGYGTGNDKWALIASPLVVDGGIDPTTINNLADGEFDLYRLNESPANNGNEWENYKNPIHTDGFKLVNGQGYLYANQEDVDLVFKGNFNTNTEMEVALNYTPGSRIAGFNLVGNPFPVNAYPNRSYYMMSEEGDAILATPHSASEFIAPCTGVIMQALPEEENPTVIFRTTPPNESSLGYINILLSQNNDRRNTILDNAVVSFNEDDELGKFVFGTGQAQLYIPKSDENYAIVTATRESEMPINFKTAQNGEYTLTVSETLHAPLSMLHLIDNLTGNDVDLLQTPTYTFQARTDDYASRFRLVFSFTGIDENNAEPDNDFAFISNGELIINGTGNLQVIDMLGRQLFSREAYSELTSSNASHFRLPTSDFFTSGVYVLRLVDGDNVKIQKIVVK